ncbi:MAG: hypothetical protein IPM26_07905 [Saprospiraceae bacterium]|nr:hypothetical protein [Saprospiraceae bacterium]
MTIATMLLFIKVSWGQVSVNGSGGSFSTGSGTVSFSLGQVSTSYAYNQSGIVSEGVHQPYEIFVVSGKEYSFLEVSLMPNPVSDILRIKLQNYPFNYLKYKLFDSSGKLLLIRESDGEITEIQMAGLQSSWYILEISEKNKVLKTYKIIKY